MPIRVDDFADSGKQYASQLNSQIEQVSRALMHLDKLLVAGLVDRRVLIAFREAVDRVRTTGFVVQQTIDGTKPATQISDAVLAERVSAANRVLGQLSADLRTAQSPTHIQGIDQLKETLRQLLVTLDKG